ncbi:hypothetical protein BXO87_02390 [Bacillus sp. GZB]|uniref:hypothetical protein n=1 Tax=Bacillus TaxID=1386 RepID=UPI0009779B80|nr:MULTISPECIES: hypothetical protein [Bacillus]MCZ4246969.1 hypothetical protein [Bacillus amyloliquefaciens]OMQ06874.1 hypothetical protein BXO87_02390 [Bacillus sp. GZB]
MNRYGGTLTKISTLEVGTKFYVVNGAWDGEIVEKDGIKQLRIAGSRTTPLTGKNAEYELYIDIEKNA